MPQGYVDIQTWGRKKRFGRMFPLHELRDQEGRCLQAVLVCPNPEFWDTRFDESVKQVMDEVTWLATEPTHMALASVLVPPGTMPLAVVKKVARRLAEEWLHDCSATHLDQLFQQGRMPQERYVVALEKRGYLPIVELPATF